MCGSGSFVAKSCPTPATPWTVACQAPLSMDSPGKNTGVGCHFLLQTCVLHCKLIPEMMLLSRRDSKGFHIDFLKIIYLSFSVLLDLCCSAWAFSRRSGFSRGGAQALEGEGFRS